MPTNLIKTGVLKPSFVRVRFIIYLIFDVCVGWRLIVLINDQFSLSYQDYNNATALHSLPVCPSRTLLVR